MALKVETVNDAETLAQVAARDLARTIAVARAERGVAHVCLAGGNTPLRTYELASGLLRDWTGVELWYGDERCVPYDDPDSNHGHVKEWLKAPGATWHPIAATSGPAEGALSYERELGQTIFDICHLGIGPDGHTASLFPNSPQIDATGRVAAVTDAPKPPSHRITITLPQINASRRVILLASGEGKFEAIAQLTAGPDRHTPASLIERDKLLVIADRAATG